MTEANARASSSNRLPVRRPTGARWWTRSALTEATKDALPH